jgi:hypothetical protein
VGICLSQKSFFFFNIYIYIHQNEVQTNNKQNKARRCTNQLQMGKEVGEVNRLECNRSKLKSRSNKPHDEH